MKKTLSLLLLSLSLATAASAVSIEFVPTNNGTGRVHSAHSNDGYAIGRGLLFTVDSAVDITSVGLYHDLTNISLSYVLEVFNGSTLRSGGSRVSTDGLEWIDYGFSALTLNPGTVYHLEFSHPGRGNQNFFYSNHNQFWSQDGFSGLDGTMGGDASNYVVAAFRVNAGGNGSVSVPDSGSSLALLGFALFGIAAFTRRKRR